jgi:SWI/SNF-related matrix-associated actin-dependent regulator of chromatin subfamily A3
VSNRTSSTFKAICNLQAQARWAVTGTPLQNRLGDLATICETLRVHPYDSRDTFERDIVSLWKAGYNDEAISRVKRLIHCILLRRTQGVVDLPTRTDLKFTLKLSHHEREHYSAVESNVTSTLDAAINESGPIVTTFASIIQQINELRLICNLGTHRKPKKTTLPKTNVWDQKTAQKALATLATTDTIQCSFCSLDLDAGITNDDLGSDLAFSTSTVQLFSCLKVVCSSCTIQQRDMRCGCVLTCPRAPVFYTPSSMSSGVSSPSGSAYDANDEPLPTKVKALVTDLEEQPRGTKRYVLFSERDRRAVYDHVSV